MNIASRVYRIARLIDAAGELLEAGSYARAEELLNDIAEIAKEGR